MGRVQLTGGLVQMRLWTPQAGWRRWRTHNLIVDAGEALIASLIAGTSTSFPTHAALGDGSDTPEGAQTALQGVEHTRVDLTNSTSAETVIFEATFPGLVAAVFVREAGIFNAASGGTMLARWLTTPFTLPSSGVFSFKWSAKVE